ncbi:HEPN_Apea domain-containing protein [Vibrio chagasii]|nr:HEPN_Apea domain-containing protein [Vibrio chagasii]CAH7002790.1 HEPN_Apea domain-containing protein [Vibrio chagasii]
MQTYKFISTLRYLSISESIDGWFELMPGVNITNSKTEIEKIVDGEFKKSAGLIEYEHFLEAENILYFEVSEEDFGKDLNGEQALFIWLSWVKMLINDLWFIRDNSVLCEAAFCKMTNQSSTTWTRNSLTSSAYNSSGMSCETISLNKADLSIWEKKSYSIQTYLHNSKSTSFDSFTNTNFSRVARCMRFVRAATKEQHPAVKLSHYCSAFESLFSTDNAGLSHKLSERVALFLRDYDYNPVEVFDHFKSFYDIRSNVTHGSSLRPKKEKNLSSQSQQCDTYLRIILCILLDNEDLRQLFDGKSDSFEHHFKLKLLQVK